MLLVPVVVGLLATVTLGGCSSSTASSGPLAPMDASAAANDSGPIGPPAARDAAPAPVDASTCQPGDVASFKPLWKRPSPFHQGACTRDQIVAYKTACLGAKASHDACAPFLVADSPAQRCGACIKSPDTAPIYGPLVDHQGFVELNLAGCIANVENDKDGSGCAGSFQASVQCLSAACSFNCPVTSDATFQQYQGCATTASTGGCKEYAQNAKCVDGLGDSGTAVADTCFSGTSFSERYDILVPLFCGSLADAGVEGG